MQLERLCYFQFIHLFLMSTPNINTLGLVLNVGHSEMNMTGNLGRQMCLCYDTACTGRNHLCKRNRERVTEEVPLSCILEDAVLIVPEICFNQIR